MEFVEWRASGLDLAIVRRCRDGARQRFARLVVAGLPGCNAYAIKCQRRRMPLVSHVPAFHTTAKDWFLMKLFARIFILGGIRLSDWHILACFMISNLLSK